MIIQTERDALACLGLLAHAYEFFDVPVEYPGEAAPSHVLGLNIHALIIDNLDGEVIAIDRNSIHRDGSPLQHGEQLALRTAINWIGAKRPRRPDQAIEGYYRSSMFYAKGTMEEDFLNLGATLYTTLEPCPYCASALLVSRMKRVCYLIPDRKYGGAWLTLKDAYYAGDDTTYLPLSMAGAISPFTESVLSIRDKIIEKVEVLRQSGVRDTHFLDFCRSELGEAFELLRNTKPSNLESVSDSEIRNTTMLIGLQRALGMPVL